MCVCVCVCVYTAIPHSATTALGCISNLIVGNSIAKQRLLLCNACPIVLLHLQQTDSHELVRGDSFVTRVCGEEEERGGGEEGGLGGVDQVFNSLCCIREYVYFIFESESFLPQYSLLVFSALSEFFFNVM